MHGIIQGQFKEGAPCIAGSSTIQILEMITQSISPNWDFNLDVLTFRLHYKPKQAGEENYYIKFSICFNDLEDNFVLLDHL